MKVLIIAGFLGAGKTTFIKELVKRTGRDFAIMENEYGAVNIDGALLEQADSDIKIWEMTEGCICCTRKADFAASILTIANTIDPEILLVEPTGVGELSKILANISQIEYERISLLSPITMVDSKHFERSLASFPDICKNQLEAAGTIVLSKQEGLDDEDLKALRAKIRQFNFEAQISTLHYTEQTNLWWEGLLNEPWQKHYNELGEASDICENRTVQDGAVADIKAVETIDSMSLTNIALDSMSLLILFLQGIVSGVFGHIVRAKGYLPIDKQWLSFSVVDGIYSITGFTGSNAELCDEAAAEISIAHPAVEMNGKADTATDTTIAIAKGVFIGQGLKRRFLREVLQKGLYRQPRSVKRFANRNAVKINNIKRVSSGMNG